MRRLGVGILAINLFGGNRSRRPLADARSSVTVLKSAVFRATIIMECFSPKRLCSRALPVLAVTVSGLEGRARDGAPGHRGCRVLGGGTGRGGFGFGVRIRRRRVRGGRGGVRTPQWHGRRDARSAVGNEGRTDWPRFGGWVAVARTLREGNWCFAGRTTSIQEVARWRVNLTPNIP
jgi:hypothetical protein